MTAPPLLLINGYAATAADWDPIFIAGLERSFELICPDNRGVGASALGELDRPLRIEGAAAGRGAGPALDRSGRHGRRPRRPSDLGPAHRRLGNAARAELSPAALDAQADAMAAWHASEQRPIDSATPVLIAHGNEDIVIPPENSDRMGAYWPNSRVERFAGGGHAFMAQEPERLADLITSFLHQ